MLVKSLFNRKCLSFSKKQILFYGSRNNKTYEGTVRSDDIDYTNSPLSYDHQQLLFELKTLQSKIESIEVTTRKLEERNSKVDNSSKSTRIAFIVYLVIIFLFILDIDILACKNNDRVFSFKI